MLLEHAVGDVYNISGDPTARSSVTRKSAVDDHQILIGCDCAVLVSKRRRCTLDQIEQAFAPRPYVHAVLDVVRRPVPLSRCVISLVEERIEGFEDQRLVCLFDRFRHFRAPDSDQEIRGR
jgi:hypothetical protein